MNALNNMPHTKSKAVRDNAVMVELARYEIVQTIRLLPDNGARLTAYMLVAHAARNDGERAIGLAGLDRSGKPVRLAIQTLLNPGPIDGLDNDALDWMRNELHADAECLSCVRALCKYLSQFLDNIEANQTCELDQIFASLDIVKTSFKKQFDAFVERLHDTIKQDRKDRVDSIQESAVRSRRGIEKIGEIARTVRMVSINAQIEAARAGDRGRAFSIIAQEINSLSDEISNVGRSVHDGLSDTLRLT
jgi:hypothetical protein